MACCFFILAVVSRLLLCIYLILTPRHQLPRWETWSSGFTRFCGLNCSVWLTLMPPSSSRSIGSELFSQPIGSLVNLTFSFKFSFAWTSHFAFLIWEWTLKSRVDDMVTYFLRSRLFLSGELRWKTKPTDPNWKPKEVTCVCHAGRRFSRTLSLASIHTSQAFNVLADQWKKKKKVAVPCREESHRLFSLFSQS